MSGIRCASRFDVGRGNLEMETSAPKIFNNYVISQCISNSLGLEDLSNFRIASTTIHWHLLQVFRKRAQVTLSESQGVRGYGILTELNSSDDHLQENTGLTRFRLDHFKFDDDWNCRNTFWETRGKFITSLNLHCCDFHTANSFRHFVSCKVFPKLESLTLSSPRFHCRKEISDIIPSKSEQATNLVFFKIDSISDVQFPISWKELLAYFINLQELSLKYHDRKGDKILQSVFEAIKSRQNPNGEIVVVPFKKLNITTRLGIFRASFPQPMLNFFEENEKAVSRLTTFSCDIPKSTESKKLYRLLSFIEKDLQKLILKGDKHRPGSIDSFCLPKLKSLEELQLVYLNLPGINFLTSSCGNLKTLFILEGPYEEVRAEYHNPKLLEDEIAKWTIPVEKHIVIQSLETFCCNLVYEMQPMQILNLKQWAPNLTKLLHHLDNDSITTVCREFTGLRYLYIFKSLVSDAGVTGVESPEIIDDDFVATFDFETAKSMESLTNLKHLKVLVIERKIEDYMNVEDWNHFMLTHRSIYWSILKLENLTTLQVSKNAMTPDGIGLLQASFPGIWREDNYTPQDFLKLK